MRKIVMIIAAVVTAACVSGCRSRVESVSRSVHDRDSVVARVTVMHDTVRDTVRVSEHTFVYRSGDTLVAFRDRMSYTATARSHDGLRADTVRVVVRDTSEIQVQAPLTWGQRHAGGLLRAIVVLCCLLGVCIVLLRRR